MEAINTTPGHPDANSYATVEEADLYFDSRSNTENWDKLNKDVKSAALQLATKQIDSMRFFGEKRFDDAAFYRREQSLQFPRECTEERAGSVQSAGSNYFVDSNLSNNPILPDDFFNLGFVVITEGTGKGQTFKVIDFEMATGKVTVSEDWGTTPDSTSRYILGVKIPNRVKYAVFEQALYILNGGGERQRMQSEGVVQYSIGDLSERFKESAIGGGKMPISNEAKGYLRGLWTIGGSFV